MKKAIFSILSILLVLVFVGVSTTQEAAKKVASSKIKNLKGETVNTETFSNDGKPFVISFWATWCKPCITELKAINEVFEDWQAETGVKLFAISIDDSRSSKNVPAFVKGKGLKFDVYLDENSDFKRAMNVNNPPHTFLFNGKGELVWQHTGFAPGDEEELYAKIKELTKK